MPAIERTKRIFVSDIHMGDTRSLHPPDGLHPYGLLGSDRAQMFAEFLKGRLQDPQVKQVIILGDMFDAWVCPTQLDPPQFQAIAQATHNVPIIKNLKAIADHDEIDLIYVPGNHDMMITGDILTEIIPGIDYRGTVPGRGVFAEDGIAAEHCSAYCFMNAPDTIDNLGHHLPFSYFSTRALTEYTATTGKPLLSLDTIINALRNALLHIIKSSPEPKGTEHESAINWAIREAMPLMIEDMSNLNKHSLIKVNGVDGYLDPLQVGQVEELFANMYDNWGRDVPGSCSNWDALCADISMIDPHASFYQVAEREYLKKAGKPDIVIFGHTHRACIENRDIFLFADEAVKSPAPSSRLAMESPDLSRLLIELALVEEKVKEAEIEAAADIELDAFDKPQKDGPFEYIYANSGSWIDQVKKCTFVETRIDENKARHYVKVQQYLKGGKVQLVWERYKDLD